MVWLENVHLDITITHEATSSLLRLAATASSNMTTHLVNPADGHRSLRYYI
jgi:hypothetical protein